MAHVQIDTSQMSLIDAAWPVQMAPVRAKAPRRPGIAPSTGVVFDLFAWLEVEPTRPLPVNDGHKGFDEVEMAYLGERILWETIKGLVDGKMSASFGDDIEWIQDEELLGYSFRICCGFCGIDPESLRAEVLHHVTQVLMHKKSRKPHEVLFLQERTMQRQLDALYAGRPGGIGYETAASWFASDDINNPLSFCNCCKAMDLNPIEIRGQVAKRRTKPVGYHPSAEAGSQITREFRTNA